MNTGKVRGRVEAFASSCLFWFQALHATLAKHQPLKVNHANTTTSAKLAAAYGLNTREFWGLSEFLSILEQS